MKEDNLECKKCGQKTSVSVHLIEGSSIINKKKWVKLNCKCDEFYCPNGHLIKRNFQKNR